MKIRWLNYLCEDKIRSVALRQNIKLDNFSILSRLFKYKIFWLTIRHIEFDFDFIVDDYLTNYQPRRTEVDLFPVGEIVNPTYELQMSRFEKKRDELYQEANRKFQKAHQRWEIERQDWLKDNQCEYCYGTGSNWTGESGAGTVSCYHCSGTGIKPEPKKPEFQEYEPKLIAPSPSLRVYGRIRLS